MNNKKLLFNIMSALSAFVINILINFFLSPYIVKHVGIEAFGFVSLATNFIVYIEILSTALNSMSSRFIAISVHKNEMLEASIYFSTIFISNLIFIILVLIISLPLIYNIDKFLQVPLEILSDVQLLFITLLLNFGFNLFSIVFSSVYIVKNNIYISSWLQIKSSFLKVIVIWGLFLTLTPHITYYGIGLLVATVYIRINDFMYKEKLLPNVFLDKNFFSKIKLKKVVLSGMWNLINRLGTVLSINLDILFVNIFLGPIDTGIFGLTKIIPNFFYTITGTLISVFFPNLIELYALNKYKEMMEEIISSMKLFSFLFSVPLVIFLSFGDIFFSLWLPSQDSVLLYKLSSILLASMAVIGPTTVIFNIFTVVNKLKLNSIAILCTGIINSIAILLSLKYTNWGLIGVAMIPTSVNLIRNILITIPYGAICLNSPWYKFFPIAIKAFISVLLVVIIGEIIKCQLFNNYYTWIDFIESSIILVFINFIMQYNIVLNKKERKILIKKIKNIIHV